MGRGPSNMGIMAPILFWLSAPVLFGAFGLRFFAAGCFRVFLVVRMKGGRSRRRTAYAIPGRVGLGGLLVSSFPSFLLAEDA